MDLEVDPGPTRVVTIQVQNISRSTRLFLKVDAFEGRNFLSTLISSSIVNYACTLSCKFKPAKYREFEFLRCYLSRYLSIFPPHLTRLPQSSLFPFPHLAGQYRAYTCTYLAAMQIYWNKRKCLHKKIVQLPQDWFGKSTCLPCHCFGFPLETL